MPFARGLSPEEARTRHPHPAPRVPLPAGDEGCGGALGMLGMRGRLGRLPPAQPRPSASRPARARPPRDLRSLCHRLPALCPRSPVAGPRPAPARPGRASLSMVLKARSRSSGRGGAGVSAGGTQGTPPGCFSPERRRCFPPCPSRRVRARPEGPAGSCLCRSVCPRALAPPAAPVPPRILPEKPRG